MILSKGLKHMFFAGVFFSFMNVGVKLLPNIPVLEIVFFRALIMVSITLFLIKRLGIKPFGNNKKLLLLRGFLGVTALSLYFYSLHNMPFASAVTIMQLSPIFTTLLAIIILREKIKPVQLLFFLISFIGVIFIKGFDTRISFTLLMIALTGSFISALAYNIIRKLKDTDHHLVVVLYFPLVAVPLSGAYTAFNFVMPIGMEWFILIFIGITTQIAQIQMTKALQIAKIAKVSIIRYLTIVYAIIYSYLFFDESYNYYTYFGMSLVVLGIVLNIKYSSVKTEE